MTQKEDEQTTSEAGQGASSAPELPHGVAKQFGLPHEADKTEEDVQKTAIVAAEPAASDEKTDDPVIEDSRTDAAVDDILTKEGDDLLAIQDGLRSPAASVKRGFWKKTGHFFVAWWRNKWARWITILLLLGLLGSVASIPQARYVVLNTVGVRSSASVIVLDNTTQLPLKNVTVLLGSTKVRTNVDGIAKFKDLKMGDYTLAIQRLAFAPRNQQITIGWGSNPLGTFKLWATGIQYTLSATDYLSGKSIVGAEASSDELNAVSDKNGKIVLTVEDTNTTTLDIVLSAAGYRSQEVKLDATQSEAAKVSLVPAGRTVFVSKQSGAYEVYAMDLDGQNKKMLLAGTGNENSNISLVMSPDGKRAALISTRDNMRDDDGYILYALTIIDLESGASVTVDHAQQIQPLDWVGDRLVYRMTLAGSSAADPQRSRLISYNYDTNARTQLATANQFNVAMSVKGNIYYAASSTDPQATMGLFRVKADGSSKKKLLDDEIWTGLRTAYNILSIQTPASWFAYALDSEQSEKASAPANPVSLLFADDSKVKHSVWTETRDGKGTLLLQDIAKGTNVTLAAQDGLTTPLRWIGDKAIVYRVVTSAESADYAVSPDGGQPRKLTDVTATRGFNY
jgi:hypothetical protein